MSDDVNEESGEEQQDLFPVGLLDGDNLTPQNIIKKGLDVTFKASLSKAEVPVRGGGLFDPNKRGRCLVHFVPGQYHPLPLRNKEGSYEVTGWKVTQDLRVDHVTPAGDEADLIASEFGNLCDLDPERAGEVLDSLKATFEARMGAAV